LKIAKNGAVSSSNPVAPTIESIELRAVKLSIFCFGYSFLNPYSLLKNNMQMSIHIESHRGDKCKNIHLDYYA
jgi:hypothetical protein